MKLHCIKCVTPSKYLVIETPSKNYCHFRIISLYHLNPKSPNYHFYENFFHQTYVIFFLIVKKSFFFHSLFVLFNDPAVYMDYRILLAFWILKVVLKFTKKHIFHFAYHWSHFTFLFLVPFLTTYLSFFAFTPIKLKGMVLVIYHLID